MRYILCNFSAFIDFPYLIKNALYEICDYYVNLVVLCCIKMPSQEPLYPSFPSPILICCNLFPQFPSPIWRIPPPPFATAVCWLTPPPPNRFPQQCWLVSLFIFKMLLENSIFVRMQGSVSNTGLTYVFLEAVLHFHHTGDYRTFKSLVYAPLWVYR